MTTTRRLHADLTDRGLIARACGARMYRDGLDWAPELVDGGPALDHWMRPAEVTARQSMLPASWVVAWRAGWNDAAAADLGSAWGDA